LNTILYGKTDVDVDEGRTDEDDDNLGSSCKSCELCPPLGSILTPGNIFFWKLPIVLHTLFFVL
jgi:hypothetical protein